MRMAGIFSYDCGSYTLILSAVDTTGRSFEYSKNIKVMPVTKMSFTMQETAHTDTDVNITAEYVNIDAADTRWSVAKDGVERNIPNTLTEYLTLTEAASVLRQTVIIP